MATSTESRTARSRPTVIAWIVVGVLAALVLSFAVLRVVNDWPFLRTNTLPDEEDFEYRYVDHPLIGYGHIGLGVSYLLIAMLQLWRGFRTRHFTVHRRLGRVALALGLASGVLAVVIGMLFPFGGVVEGVAAVVFGCYFVTALVVAFVAIRQGDATTHRRWMIRAFAVALGVGTIRIWFALLLLAGMSFENSLAGGFAIALPLHALAAEVYLRIRPDPPVS